MTDIGIVKSVYTVAKKTIVAVSLRVDLDQIQFDTSLVQFGVEGPRLYLDGHKWWPDRQEIDLLFDDLGDTPDVGTSVAIVSEI